jgi:hypothetical protein
MFNIVNNVLDIYLLSLWTRLVCVIFRQVKGDKPDKGILWSSMLGVEHGDDDPTS